MSNHKNAKLIQNGLLSCSLCKENKPLFEFNKNKQQTTGYNYACRACSRINVRAYNLKTKYGITIEEYTEKLQKQNYKCACCLVKLEINDNDKNSKAPHVDHNHKTGEVRDILCARCNLAAGNVLDSSEMAEKLVSYLKKWGC